MAGDIRTKPMTREYEEGWLRAFTAGEIAAPPDREVRPHDCEHCGRHFEYADQECACTAISNARPHVQG